MAEAKQSSGRMRRWLEKRREARRRGAELSARAKAARKHDVERASRRGGVGPNDGPFGGI